MNSMTERGATVTSIRTRRPVEPGYLPYRACDPADLASAHNPTRLMATIESQAAQAWAMFDGDADSAHAVLAANGCHVDLGDVHELFRLAQDAQDAVNVVGGDVDFARAEYQRWLGYLAEQTVTRSSGSVPAREWNAR